MINYRLNFLIKQIVIFSHIFNVSVRFSVITTNVKGLTKGENIASISLLFCFKTSCSSNRFTYVKN